MKIEIIVKYSVPFFVIAIISRSIEEISFFYYAVPVMCLMFIVLLFISSKFNSTRNLEGDPSTPLKMTKPKEESIRYPESGIKFIASIISARGGFHFAQHLPSSIIHQPFLLFLLPGLWFLLTSLWSSYPEVSATRALYFILISTGCISAGILWIRYSGRNIFELLLPANVIVALLCLLSLITNIPFDSWTAGHGKGFTGFFGHQNLLASVLLFTIPVVVLKLRDAVISDQLQVIRNKKFTVHYLLITSYSLLLTANLLFILLTYSRSAILSLIFGVIVFLIMNRSWKMLAYSFATAAVLGVITYSVPSLNQFADKIIKKDFPEVYSSRLWMWEPSYKAALEGGLFGLGYGISHPEIRSGEYSDRFEDERLIREKGNSSFALIEESGLIGLILFILPIIYLLIKLPDTRYLIPDKDYKSGTCLPVSKVRNPASPSSLHFNEASSIQNLVSSILIASLAAFLLHAQFEAWWVGVGSVPLPLFFIYLGLLFNNKVSQPVNNG